MIAAKPLIHPRESTGDRKVYASTIHALDQIMHRRQPGAFRSIELREPAIASHKPLTMLDDLVGKDMDVRVDDPHGPYRKKYQITRIRLVRTTSAIRTYGR